MFCKFGKLTYSAGFISLYQKKQRFTKECTKRKAAFILVINFVRQTFCSDRYIPSYLEMNPGRDKVILLYFATSIPAVGPTSQVLGIEVFSRGNAPE
jgi:hypothetical protein